MTEIKAHDLLDVRFSIKERKIIIQADIVFDKVKQLFELKNDEVFEFIIVTYDKESKEILPDANPMISTEKGFGDMIYPLSDSERQIFKEELISKGLI